MFLVGALAVYVRPELGMSATQVGAVVSVFFGSSAVVSVPGGRVGDRLGASWTMLVAAGGSAVSLLGIAAFARSWSSLLGFAVVGGIANGFTQPAANRALVRGVPPAHQGAAFGAKQAAIPLATLAGGAAVPLVGERLGWRWAFIMAAMLVVPLAALLQRRIRVAPPRPPGGRARVPVSIPPLLLLSVACGVAAAPANAMGTFLVESLVDRGWSAGGAGVIMVVGSATGIVARVAAGWQADRREGRPLVVVAALIGTGAIGVFLVGLSTAPVPVVAGAGLAFGAGWGWTGLLNFAVSRLHPQAASAATGITHAGQQAGAVVGPLAFGMIVDTVGFPAAWLAAAWTLVAAAALIMASRVPLLRAVDVQTHVD